MALIQDYLSGLLKNFFISRNKSRFPQTSGNIKHAFLSAPVEVMRDDRGVPHIYAQNEKDLFFTQGYVHAQDRLWQMELSRRVAKGKLCEVLGKEPLDADRMSRTFGFDRIGRKDMELMDESNRLIIECYVKGINAFIESSLKKLPVEFTIARFKPEPWDTTDVMAFSRMMVWSMSFGWYSGIVRSNIISKVGEEAAAELEIEYPHDNPATLPKGIEKYEFVIDEKLQSIDGDYLKLVKGSNAWAVSGKLTDTGKPYLCNDPHLPMMLPSIWHENHLEAGDYKVRGVSTPGLPMIMIGHNSYIAWGMTLSYIDIQDLFIEKFTNEECTEYEYNGQIKKAEVFNEEIKIKGKGKPFIEKVIVTQHGPIISEVVNFPQKKVALCSMALKAYPIIKGWSALNRAKNWNDFNDALKYIIAPSVNVPYADIYGNIGYRATASVPIRKNGFGKLPVPGWTDEYEWVGEVPYDEMPHALNPERGFVITCNHKVIDENFPHYLGCIWMNGYRANRLENIFASNKKLSMQDFKEMQMDFMCLPGLKFKEHFKGLKSSDEKIQSALAILTNWDGHLTADSVGGSLYEVTRFHLIQFIIESVLGTAITHQFKGCSFNPVLSVFSEYFGHDTVVLLKMLDNSNSWWMKKAGNKQEVLLKSFEKAVGWLTQKSGKDMNKWQWGNIHSIVFPHPMEKVKPLDKIFNLGPFPLGGDTDTLHQSAFKPSEPFGGHIVAPSFRMVVDMSDLDNTKTVLPPGQSGWLGHAQYDDQIQKWLKGEYYTAFWDKDKIQKEMKYKLMLEPK
jgi:penicillin amidase